MSGLFGLAGLFKNSTKTTVATTVSRVIENDSVPDSLKSGPLKAMLQEGNLVDYVMEDLIASMGVRADKMYRYGKNTYTHGLPSGTYLSEVDAKDRVEAVIATLEGSSIPTTYCYYGPANLSHVAWVKAIELYGLDTKANTLSTLTATKGTTVYMVDLQTVIPAATVDTYDPVILEQWGGAKNAGYTPKRPAGSATTSTLAPTTPLIKDTNTSSIYFKLTYCWETSSVSNGVTTVVYNEESVDIPYTGYILTGDYFQARYVKDGAPKFFTYLDGTGTYPNLDEIYTTAPTTAGTFFPFTYFRYNKVSEISNKTTDAYRTSKKMVKYLGMDYDDIAENINSNPNIADVEQAMMIMAVPATTTNPIEMRYLFDFFNSVHGATTVVEKSVTEAKLESRLGGYFDIPSSAIVIEDKRFKMALNNLGVYKRKVAGVLGKIGTCTSSVTSNTSSIEFKDFQGNFSTQTVPSRIHTYRKQVSSVTYEEIQVVNLSLTYYILNGYSVVADDEEDILLVPIDKAISDLYKISDREELYSRSLHFVFNSVQITTVKWYQTGAFKIFMYAVAIIITIYSGGTATAAWSSIMAGMYAQAAILIFTMVIERILISLAFKLFVKAVGIKAAFIVAIVAAAAGMYQAIDAGSIAGAPWAKELLALSSGLSEAGNSLLKADYEDLLGDYTEFQQEIKEKLKLLDEAKDLLNTSARLSPFVIFGESPNEFYNRTIHAGNIGVVGIDAISSFVDISLKLPTLNDTINS